MAEFIGFLEVQRRFLTFAKLQVRKALIVVSLSVMRVDTDGRDTISDSPLVLTQVVLGNAAFDVGNNSTAIHAWRPTGAVLRPRQHRFQPSRPLGE